MGTADKAFQLQIGGRLLFDFAWISEDKDVERVIGHQQDGTSISNAWIFTQGELFERVFFKVEYGMEGGDVDIRDAFIGIKGIPYVGNVQVGHCKEPFSLDWRISRRFITFMERGLPVALGPDYNVGLSLFDSVLEDRMTWNVGVFKDTDSYAEQKSDGEWSLTGRVTGLPWYEDKGPQLVHVGLSASLRSPTDNTLQYRTRPEMGIADYFADTGTFEAERTFVLGPELAAVYGPASLQAEYIQSWVTSDPGDDPVFKGYYVYGSYFLTGESRAYSRTQGAFSRLKPIEDFLGKEDGWGALEAAVRYSWLDLNDGTILGGELADITVGLNWYLNPYVRVMMNYVRADLDKVGVANGFMTRFQVDF